MQFFQSWCMYNGGLVWHTNPSPPPPTVLFLCICHRKMPHPRNRFRSLLCMLLDLPMLVVSFADVVAFWHQLKFMNTCRGAIVSNEKPSELLSGFVLDISDRYTCWWRVCHVVEIAFDNLFHVINASRSWANLTLNSLPHQARASLLKFAFWYFLLFF